MPEQLPEPPSDMNFNVTTPVHSRAGTTTANPIVENCNQVQRGEISTTKPNYLSFPYAVTPHSNNPKIFFHQSTYEQSPSTAISETIWFKNDDPTNYAKADHDSYNPLLSILNWAKIPYENKHHIFHLNTFHQQQNRLLEFIPTRKENAETVKQSGKNMGLDQVHQSHYPQLKQFYILTEIFFTIITTNFIFPEMQSLIM